MLTTAASERLQNTPAVCRNSYIHPSILSLTDDVTPLQRLFAQPLAAEARLRGLRAEEQRLLGFLWLET